jgi:hypothetical protein
MTTTCANGHDSTESDYCSVCGTRIEGAAGAAPVDVAPAAPDAGAAGSAPGELCPNCSSELDPGTRFCEVCGYDPNTGSLPKAPVVQPADPVDAAGDAAPADPAAAVPDAGAAAPAPVGGTWVAVVTADRAYYDRNKVTEVQFPLGVPARTITLEPGKSHTIGRRSHSRGTNPEIDLAGPPEDAAVSHTHASLLSKDDGSWELVDHGSTNGTYVNEGPDPVAANTPIPLVSGDRIYVGAWTQITLQHTP